jgi:hypothetical protein
VQDSEDGDDECNQEEDDEGEDEESEDENGSASDADASLLRGNYLFSGFILYSLIKIYCIHWFQFILQWKKQSIPTKSNPTSSTKMASADQDLQSGFVNYLG